MLFAVCCDRGAPGATTVALALAAARGLPAVVVEADPYGGDLALRCRAEGRPLPATPTVLGLGTGRSSTRPAPRPIAHTTGEDRRDEPRLVDLWRTGSHPLSDLVRVVPGFLTAEHGGSLAWPGVAAALQSQSVPVFADLGRIHTGSPSMPIAAAADALITVCRGDQGSVYHLIERLEQLVPAIAEKIGRPPVVMPVLVTGRRNGDRHAAQVAELLGKTAVGPTLRGVGWLAWDPAGVSRLEAGENPWAKPLQNSHLIRSARKVMWLLGMATGIDHATPGMGRKKVRRRAPEDAAGLTQQPMTQPTQAGLSLDRALPGPPPSWAPAGTRTTDWVGDIAEPGGAGARDERSLSAEHATLSVDGSMDGRQHRPPSFRSGEGG